MAEYIDREKLRQKMYQEAFVKDSDLQRWDSGCWIRYKLFENVLEKTDVADVQPVKHGRWKQKKETLGRGPMYAEIYVWECTACKSITPVDVDKYYYCPVCGAKMDGGA